VSSGREQLALPKTAEVDLPTKGLVLPQFQLVAALVGGEKTLFVQSKVLKDLAGERFALVSEGLAVGVASFGEMVVLGSDGLKKTVAKHMLDEDNLEELRSVDASWRAPPYFAWPVKSSEALEEPLQVEAESTDGLILHGVTYKQAEEVSKPFSGFETFDACVTEMQGQGKSESAARAICGRLQEQAEKRAPQIELDIITEKTDRELLALNQELHRIHAQHFGENQVLKADGFSRDYVVTSAVTVEEEMLKRGFGLSPVDALAQEMVLTGYDREQAEKILSKNPVKALENAGPPDEWSGCVAAMLGSEQRKQLTEVWGKLSTKEKARIQSKWEAQFESETEKKRYIPFYSWGGSVGYAKRVSALFPQHSLYVEPFCGSAAVFFAKEMAAKSILTDIDPEVVFALNFIKNLTNRQLSFLRKFPWKGSKAQFKRGRYYKPTTDSGRFWKFVYGRTFSWSGKGYEHGFAPSNKSYDLDALLEFQEKLKHAEIKQLDWRETIKQYDSPTTMFFIDPPYDGEWAKAGETYSPEHLVEALKGAQGKYIIAYTDSDHVRSTLGSISTIFSMTTNESRARSGNTSTSRLFATNLPTDAPQKRDPVAELAKNLAGDEQLYVLDLRDEYDSSWTVDVKSLDDADYLVAAQNTEPIVFDMEGVGEPFTLPGAPETAFVASREIDRLETVEPSAARKEWKPEGKTFLEHATHWVRSRGLLDSDSDYDGMLGEAVLRLAKTFSEEGHSGMSAMAARTYFNWLMDAWDGVNTITLNDEDLERVRETLAKQSVEHIAKTWLKEKTSEPALKKVRAIVSERRILSNPGLHQSSALDTYLATYMAVGPIAKSQQDQWQHTVEVRDRLYVAMPDPVRAADEVDLSPGDIVSVAVSQLSVDLNETKKSIDWCPVLVEPTEGRPMTPREVANIADAVGPVTTTPELRILKSHGEERYVQIVVLEPETTDAQGDIYSAEEIRRAAHYYMLRSRKLKVMHQGAILSDQAAQIVESFIAPMTYKVDGETIVAGAWVMGFKIWSDELWAQIKSGAITGVSIGGLSYRVPLAA
jgi:DNA adenine methylase